MGASPSQHVEREFQKFKQEVMQIKPAIRTNVRDTVFHIENAVSMRYSQLRDKENVIESVSRIFGGLPGLGFFVVKTASRLERTLTSLRQIHSMIQWYMCKKFVRQGNHVYGMELQYKFKILEEETTDFFHQSSDAVMLVAFNYMVHIMDYDPENFPDDQELGKLPL